MQSPKTPNTANGIEAITAPIKRTAFTSGVLREARRCSKTEGTVVLSILSYSWKAPGIQPVSDDPRGVGDAEAEHVILAGLT